MAAKRLSQLTLWFLLVVWPLAGGPALFAQTTDTPRDPGEQSVSRVEESLRQAKENVDLPEEQKARLIELYGEALENLKRAESWTERTSDLDKKREQAPATLEAIRKELAEPLGGPQVSPPADASLDQLEQLLAQVEAELKAARAESTALDEERKRRSDRRAELPALITDVKKQLDAAMPEISAPVDAAESTELSAARRIAHQARRKALQWELKAHEAEVASYDARGDLLTARRDQATRTVARTEKLARAWQELVNERRRQEAEAAKRTARREAARSHPALKELAAENSAWAERRAGAKLADRIDLATKELERISQLRDRVVSDFANVTEKVEKGGLTYAMGTALRRNRDLLPNLRQHQAHLEARRTEMSALQIELIELDDDRTKLVEGMERLIAEVLDLLDGNVPNDERAEIAAAARGLLEARRGFIVALQSDYDQYFNKLAELDHLQDQLIHNVQAFAAYIDERILWIRSATPPRLSDLSELGEALAWLLDPVHWRKVVVNFWLGVTAKPLIAVLSAMALAALLSVQRRMRRLVAALGEEASRSTAQVLWPTFHTLILTVIIAGTWPAMLATLGWWLTRHTSDSGVEVAAGNALRACALALFGAQFLRQICRPGGLGEAHFGWASAATAAVRRHVSWLAMVGLPLVFVVSMCAASGTDAFHASLGRLAFIVGQVLLAVTGHRVLRPDGPVFMNMAANSRFGVVFRFRYVWSLFAVAIPILLAVLAVAGFYYTAIRLTTNLYLTLWIVVLVITANAASLRWLLISRRRLALAQWRRRREESSEESERAPVADLSSLSAQTRKLLRTLAALVLILGFWMAWDDVLPALRILDRVSLWSTTMSVSETKPESNGVEQTEWVDRPVDITLRDLGLALVIVAMTILVSRNLPGLLEMILLQRLRLEPGVLYAIVSVCKYCVVVVGVVFSFGAIGIGWSKVQWLAAAITVGLGFGLQEIFANFVSGLIILFERPIRLGDIVTVGEIEGKVTDIRIRATTIMDWDMREMIVPNKEFITGRLINWTLSEPTTRVTVRVGIAYGSDTALAHELLLKVARECPLVMDDPKPHALFRHFGESSLDFELRVYIASRDVWVPMMHELHMAIDREFRKAGIEIAFPQRDLHIRSFNAVVPVDQRRREE